MLIQYVPHAQKMTRFCFVSFILNVYELVECANMYACERVS